MDRVLLIVMPFCGVERPQVGVSTLKAQLQQHGIPCDIVYFNIPFAEAVGYDVYHWITSNYSYDVFGGEWVFARSLFSDREIDYNGYLNEILTKTGAFTPEKVRRITSMAPRVGPFLDYCMRAVDWDRYSIVGFTSTFEQNLASLSLAKRLKERFPEKIIMMGGGNCGGPMGGQLHKSFPFLDFVFTGEADLTFPELVRRLASGDPRRDDLKGYVRREGSKSVETEAASLIQNLDALPYPDFEDYFRQFRNSRISREASPTLQIETARGCWWGAKQHCTFCGLNRDEMSFRSKSPERALDEILHLVTRYGVKFVSSVDNIISMQYFKTVLPELKRMKLGVQFFYETKANLKKEQVKLLHDAGVVFIQPGIEAFSDNVLKLMRKGVSPLQNVQLLKWCRQYGVVPQWNLLYGFPGENSKDYADTLGFIRSLGHLPPPLGYGPLRLDRFSPYFDFPDRYGIRNIRPFRPYRYLFPFEEPVLHNLAYFFEYEFDGKEKRDRWFEPVREEIEFWKEHYERSRLAAVFSSKEALVVRDSRPNRTFPEYRFRNPEKAVIEFCDEPRHLREVVTHVHALSNGSSPPETRLQSFLSYLVERRLMLRAEDRYLSLILPPPAGAAAGEVTPPRY